MKTGQVNFLGKQDEVPNWMTQKTITYKLTLGSDCYLYKDGMVYTINTQTLTIKETDLRDVFEGEKAVASLEELNGKPYIRYTVPRDETTNFYGYMDLQGNIKIDALLTKVVRDENIYHDTTKCRQFGSYLLFGKFLFDLDFNVIGREMRIVYIQEEDNVRGSLMETGLVSIYNRYAGEQFMGFLYDSKTDTIIKKYDKLTDVYLGLNVYDYRRDRYGHYYAMKLSDGGGIAWFDINTKKEVARGKGYCYVETERKNYNILEDSKEVVEPNIVLDQSYEYKGGMYRVISVKNRLVSFNKCCSKVPNIIIPDTIKIKGKQFKVIAIDEKAFYGRKKLTSVVIGKNVKQIEEKAFLHCKKLKSITIKGKVLTSVDKTALIGTNKKLIIKVPSAKKTAYKKLWKGKGNASVTIK